MRISDWSSDVCSSDLPARPRAWRDGAARSFRCLPRADGGDQGRIFSGRIVAEEVERAAMIFASFGAASGDMPPRIFVAGEYLVGIDALKLKGVGAADFAPGENAQVFAVRSDERRVGNDCCSTGRSRWSQVH